MKSTIVTRFGKKYGDLAASNSQKRWQTAWLFPPDLTFWMVEPGSGETSCFLAAEYKWNVLSVEIDPQEVPVIQRKANERGLAGVVAIRGNLADLDLADESVDGVICQGVFEMLDEQRPKALREMKRILRPGGRIGIADPMQTREVPDDEALRLYGEDDPCRFRKLFRTLEWNVDLANRTDLEVISAYYHPDS